MSSSVANNPSIFNFKLLQSRLDFLSKIFLICTAAMIPVSVGATNVFILMTVVLSLCAEQSWIKLRKSWDNPVVKASLLLFLVCAISVIYTENSWSTAFHGLHKYAKLLYIPLLFPLFSEEKWRTRALNAFIIVMLITLTLSYMKYLGWISIGKTPAPDTIFKNHIETSFFLAFFGFLFIHKIFEVQERKWLYISGFLLLAFNLFFINEGRTGYLIFITLMGLFAWQRFRWKGILTSLVILPLLLFSIYSFSGIFKSQINIINSNLEKYEQRELEGNSVGLRMEFAKNSFQLIKQHPLLGYGVGAFHDEYTKNYGNPPGFLKGLGDPHNEYLMVITQTGVLGFVLLLLLFYTEWETSFYLNSLDKYFSQGFLIAMMVGCLCDSFLYLTATGHFFVYFSALFFAASPRHALFPFLNNFSRSHDTVGSRSFGEINDRK
ncbi:MAG: O-antigen ligase family protein [Proteobacteria bacterium]|nr:O-antigen ligase family protein [Pseudomonadota bacterium]